MNMVKPILHDEIQFFGRTLIIDTAALPFYGDYQQTVYETMALYQDGHDIKTWTADDEQTARKNHAEMLADFQCREQKRVDVEQKKPAPLKGKYAKLRDDLIAAYAETEYLEQTEDGGTCNFDAPVLHLDRWNAKKIKQAAEEAGSGAFRWTCGKFMMGWVFATKSSGQANRRTRRAEAISDALKAKGYDASVYYAMD